MSKRSDSIHRDSSTPLDLLLVHTPKLNNFYNPFGYFVMNNVVSWGTYAVADWADQSGFSAQILHLGAEILFTPGFRMGQVVERTRPRLIGMSCHWHYQLADVLELAARIKEREPSVRVVLGGYTATLFAEEILSSSPAVDFVVRGEAEAPVAQILKHLAGDGRLEEVPNLTYREQGSVRHNPITFTADKEFLERLTFCRLDLFPNYRTYLKHLSYPIYLRSYPRFFNYKFLTTGRLEGYMVPVGRGCSVNCAYCGGGKDAAERHFGRSQTTLISPERVADDVERAASFGVESLYFPFDPFPRSDYFPRVFERIRGRGLSFDATFEIFALPTPEFIEGFVRTFGTGKRNQILLSPETGDEALRERSKGFFYSNAELLETMDRIEKAGATVQVSYSLGLPGETEETLEATRSLWKQIERRYRNIILQTATLIDPDPASPAERAGLTPAYTFDGLLRTHRESHQRSWTGWTYLPMRHTCPELAADAEGTHRRLQRYKCAHFCSYMEHFRIVSPWNRMICVLAGLFFRVVRRPLRLSDYI